MANRIDQPGFIQVGDFFESCSFHPCFCSAIDESGAHIEGISLVNGHLHSCNVRHCGIRTLTTQEAISWRLLGPDDTELPVAERWW